MPRAAPGDPAQPPEDARLGRILKRSLVLGENPVKRLIAFLARKGGDYEDGGGGGGDDDDCNDDEAELRLYRLFMADSISFGFSANVLACLPDSVVRRYYGPPDREPKFCSIADHSALEGLKRLTGRHFVLYFWKKRTGACRALDTRCLWDVCGQAGLGSSEGPREAYSFLLYGSRYARSCKIALLSDELACLGPKDSVLQDSPFSSASEPVTSCGLRALCLLLGGRTPPQIQEPWSLSRVCTEASLARRLLGRDCLLAVRVGAKIGKGCPLNPRNNAFMHVSLLSDRSPGAAAVDWRLVPVVLVGFHDRIFLADEATAGVVKQDRRAVLTDLPHPLRRSLPDDLEEELRARRAREEQEGGGGHERAESFAHSPCSCQLCRSSVAYRRNLQLRGGQKLYTVEPDLRTLLRCFALDTEDNLARVKLCLRLSVAGMDLETSTWAAGCKGLSSERKPCEESVPLTPISGKPMSGDQELAQRILMIGHYDRDLPWAEGEYKIIESARSPEGAREACHSYVAYVVSRQKLLSDEKEALLAPLMEFTLERKRAFFAYCLENVPPESRKDLKIEAAWAASLLGQLDRRLRKLAARYSVQAFNGSGFDLPLLAGHIITNPHTPGGWKVSRKGSQVTQLSLPRLGLYFRGGSFLSSFLQF